MYPMKVILDNREHTLFEKCCNILDSSLKPYNIQLLKETLVLGDILLTTDEDKPVLLIERKSFADLLASIKDGRYEEQSYRLKNASEFPSHSIYYVLEGMFSQLKNHAEKNIILSASTSLSFFKGYSVYRTATIQETAEWILHMADKIEREFGKGNLPYYLQNQKIPTNLIENTLTENNEKVANYCSVVKKIKKENVTPENIGEIVLCQIPGISSATAIAIMKKYNKFTDLIDSLKTDSQCLENITLESGRKINKSSIENIKKYFGYSEVVHLEEQTKE
jgi:ERCC4-type nuclease